MIEPEYVLAQRIADDLCDYPHDLDQIAKHIRPLIDALEAIKKCEGRFSRDPLTHASNTIANMQYIAINALAEIYSRTTKPSSASGSE